MVYLYLFRFLSIVIQIRMKASFIESKAKAESILCLSPSLSASKIPAYPRSAAAGPWLEPRNSVITESDGRGGEGGAARGETQCPVLRGARTTSPSPAINWSFHQCGDSSPVLRPALVRPPELCRCRSHTFRKNGHFVGFTTSLEPRRTRANLPPAGLLPTNLTLMMATFATFSGDDAKMDFKVELKKWALERSTRKEH